MRTSVVARILQEESWIRPWIPIRRQLRMESKYSEETKSKWKKSLAQIFSFAQLAIICTALHTTSLQNVTYAQCNLHEDLGMDAQIPIFTATLLRQSPYS